MRGMILAAGLGSRLKPLTDKTPKPLLQVGDFRMLDLILAFLHKHGVDELIINVHHLADQMMEYVIEKRWEGLKIEISDETEQLLNTGGGMLKASDFLKQDKDFVLMASDILTDLNLSEMIAQHRKNKSLATLAVKERKTSRDLMFDSNNCLSGWKNNQTGEVKEPKGRLPEKSLGFSGIHVLNSSLFEKIIEKGAFSIIDLYLRLAETECIKAYDHSGGKWLEFGRLENIENARETPEFKYLTRELFS
jgi:MurNAc alpha-1-phosphate uridylyltransferase